MSWRVLVRRTGAGVGALVVTVAASALVLAQQRALPPEPGETTVGQLRADGTEPPTFRAGVTLVTTDVIVRDRDGLFLSELGKDDFKIFEDGVEQELASLVMIHGGRVYNQLDAPPPVREGIILPASRPPSDTAGRIFIFFIDDLHLTTSQTPRIRQLWTVITDTLVHEGDLFGVISTGPSSLSIDMTYNRKVLREVEERITGDALTIQDQIRTQETQRGPAEVLYRAHVAFKTVRSVLTNLERVNDRRKVFIYLSNGYDFDPFADSRSREGLGALLENAGDPGGDVSGLENPQADPFSQRRQGQQFANTDLSGELAELTRVANRANTSFYTVDPRGLVAGPDIDQNIPVQEWRTHIFQTQNTLRMLAELTGGMAVVNRNDFKNALSEIDAETSDYYVLGFYSTNPDPTIRTRRLRVEVAGRDDLDIRARTEYTLPRPSEQ